MKYKRPNKSKLKDSLVLRNCCRYLVSGYNLEIIARTGYWEKANSL